MPGRVADLGRGMEVEKRRSHPSSESHPAWPEDGIRVGEVGQESEEMVC